MALYDRFTLPDDPAAFWETIQAYTREGLELLKRAPYSNQLLSRMGHALANDAELSARAKRFLPKPVRTLVDIWKRGQDLGVIRSDIRAETLISVFQGIKEALLREYVPDGGTMTNEELDLLTELQMDLFRRVSEAREGCS
jgi:hypothetical protein